MYYYLSKSYYMNKYFTNFAASHEQLSSLPENSPVPNVELVELRKESLVLRRSQRLDLNVM